jgi:hypothetical protein
MRLALASAVPLRLRLARTLAATLIIFTALISIGLTAPPDGPLTIAVRPVLLNLGVDVDVKIWSIHLHFTWSALSLTSASTKPGGTLL